MICDKATSLYESGCNNYVIMPYETRCEIQRCIELEHKKVKFYVSNQIF